MLIGLLLGTPGFIGARTTGFILNGNAKSVKIPIEIQNNIILIPIQINGSFEMNFILDTGVRTTILTEPVIASFLDLDRVDRIRVRGLGSGTVINAALARNVRMSIPGVTGAGINLIVLPSGVISYSGMFGKPVYGIIGYEIFGQFVVEIDYHHKYIRLSDPNRFTYRGKGIQIPIDIQKSKPYVAATVLQSDGQKIRARWLVDTGASQALSMFSRDLEAPAQSIVAFVGIGLGGDVHGKLGRVIGLEIGNFFLEDVIAGYPDSASLSLLPNEISWYGNMGSAVLSRFHVIFDYPGKRLILKKGPKYRKPFRYNISGLELIAIGDEYNEFMISYVRPNSPAAAAGLQARDEILSLNGFSTSNLDLNNMYNGLDKKAGRVVSLKIRRGNEVFKRKFTLTAEI